MAITTNDKKKEKFFMDTARLSKSVLFRGMSEKEITDCLEKLDGRTVSFRRREFIMHAGNSTLSMGMVLSGSVTIETNDLWGNRTILSHVGANGYFAETYACVRDAVMPVDVTASEDCEILFLSVALMERYTAESWKQKLTGNLLTVSMNKNLVLSGRIFNTSPRTIRERVLSYLSSVSLQKRSTEFDIPFDRQQLADYLNVERTALSKELGKMKKDGLISVRKNHFVLIAKAE